MYEAYDTLSTWMNLYLQPEHMKRVPNHCRHSGNERIRPGENVWPRVKLLNSKCVSLWPHGRLATGAQYMPVYVS